MSRVRGTPFTFEVYDEDEPPPEPYWESSPIGCAAALINGCLLLILGLTALFCSFVLLLIFIAILGSML